MVVHQILGPRPDQLHRPLHLPGDQRDLPGNVIVEIAVERAAAQHRIERHPVLTDVQRAGGRLYRRDRCLRRHPQFQPTILIVRRRRPRFDRRVNCGIGMVTGANAVVLLKHPLGLAARDEACPLPVIQRLLQGRVDPVAVGQKTFGLKHRTHLVQRPVGGPPVGRHRCDPGLALDHVDKAGDLGGALAIEGFQPCIANRSLADGREDHVR